MIPERPPNTFTAEQAKCLEEAEAARCEIRTAIRRRIVRGRRRVLYPARVVDQLVRAMNELGAVKFDVRWGAHAEAAAMAGRVQRRLGRVAAKVPAEIAEHLVAAGDRLDVFEGLPPLGSPR